jgi:hypothetical protein
MFSKCIRGDAGDNVMSSYPRLRQTKIREAFLDPFKRENIMQNEFKSLENIDGEVKEMVYKTREVFKENEILMDLEKQPGFIREAINETINDEIQKQNCFDYISFLRFCSKNKLNNILDKAEKFVPMLSGKSVNK